MKFVRVQMPFASLLNPSAYNQLVMDGLEFEQKKTLGMLILLTKLRQAEKRGNPGICRIFLDDCMDLLLKGEEAFGAYLVSLFEAYLNALFRVDEETGYEGNEFRCREFVSTLEEVHRRFAPHGVVLFRKCPLCKVLPAV